MGEERRGRDLGHRRESPSPSLRHISHTRVNNFERKRLIPKKDFVSKVEYNSIYEGENQPLDIGRPRFEENDSILYNSTDLQPENSTNSNLFEESLREMGDNDNLKDGHDHEHEHHDDEYQPVRDHHMEDLAWSDILPYYLPILSWVHSYSVEFFIGDLIGGLSLVFFQLPLSLSYATSLAHVPVLSGLLSLGISPIIYLLFGSVPQMIVGPEAAISLIVGQAVEPLLHHKKSLNPIDLVVAITFVSGASLLGFGLGRFGFLDNVLSGSLLKGFISGVGIVMVINSLISMLGLNDVMKEINDNPADMDIHSPFDKLVFLMEHFREYEPLTFKISIIGLLFLMLVTVYKKIEAKRNTAYSKKLIYIPEILIMVIISSFCCYKYKWNDSGIDIIGKVHNENGVFSIYNPITFHQFKLMKKLSTAGFLCAMLGFFESTTASKSLGSRFNLPISSNRELVALGCINLVGAMFGALPAFGGYGRSKINAISAKTTMSGCLMGIVTILTIFFLLDSLYYIPKCILSVITAKIGISLVEEAPYELMFHWRSRGYNELITFFVTVLTTLFFSMEAGIAVGLVYSLIRVIKHSAMSRIQILGRIPGTNTFVDADINENLLTVHYDQATHNKFPSSQLNLFTDGYFTTVNTEVLEEIEGCLIVKIPEPLTFTNCSDLKGRLKRVEMYGSTKAHPGLKRSRDESMTQYVIFDLRGMSELDSSAAQILKELIINYQNRDIASFFIRVSKHLKVRKRLESTGITDLLNSDLTKVKYYQAQEELRSNQLSIMTENPNLHEILDLTEMKTPYFGHISDALKVIDYYESIREKYDC
ncbi:putative sulfate transporter [[Candida] jaroonii]|uniref:Sulfate transporter n=1 Tax=[Candida] jaroonii TaxID=467808 RepID=A0ACA9Y5H9_9ASCO|nr:putative sulfate transporter [[Candida] jaroonii]